MLCRAITHAPKQRPWSAEAAMTVVSSSSSWNAVMSSQLRCGVRRRCNGSMGSHANLLGSKTFRSRVDYDDRGGARAPPKYCDECFPDIQEECKVARRVNPIGHPLSESVVSEVAKSSYLQSSSRDVGSESQLADRDRFWRAHSSGLLGFLKAQVNGASSCLHPPAMRSARAPASLICGRRSTSLLVLRSARVHLREFVIEPRPTRHGERS